MSTRARSCGSSRASRRSSLSDVTDELERIGLARQKWPEELRIVDDFPRTASGKVRKVDLRRQLRAGDR